jgi:hypothetical protein
VAQPGYLAHKEVAHVEAQAIVYGGSIDYGGDSRVCSARYSSDVSQPESNEQANTLETGDNTASVQQSCWQYSEVFERWKWDCD